MSNRPSNETLGWGKTCPASTYYHSDSLVTSKQQNLFNV